MRLRSIPAAGAAFALLLGVIAANGVAGGERGVVAGTETDDLDGPLPGARIGIVAARATPVSASRHGVVSGAVLDERGDRLPGARVEIAGPSWKAPETSGGMGFFQFDELAAGEYTVTVSHPSFATSAQKVVVRPGETITISVQLRGGR